MRTLSYSYPVRSLVCRTKHVRANSVHRATVYTMRHITKTQYKYGCLYLKVQDICYEVHCEQFVFETSMFPESLIRDNSH